MRSLKPLALALLLLSHAALADEKPAVSGVFHAQEVPGSPALKASGMVWWNGRLVIADYGEHQLLGFSPPDKFELIRKLTHPVGLAVDAKDRLVVTEKFTTTHLKDLPPAKDGKDALLGWVGRLQGLAVDKDGCIYVGGAESHNSGAAVAVFTPDGKTLTAMIVDVPRNISGLAIGGDDGRALFITGAGEYKLHQVKLPAPAPPAGSIKK